MITIYLTKSTKKNKKWTVSNPKIGTVHFGDSRYEDYTQHKDPERKENYLKRHRKSENWNLSGIKTAAFWARWIGWNKKTIDEAIDYLNNKYKSINIIRKTT